MEATGMAELGAGCYLSEVAIFGEFGDFHHKQSEMMEVMEVVPPAHDFAVAAGISVLSGAVVVAVAFIYGSAKRKSSAALALPATDTGAAANAASGGAGVSLWSNLRGPLAAGVAWMALTFVLANTGLLQRFDVTPPPALLFLVALIGVALILGLSTVGRQLSDSASLIGLVALQSFRLPLELTMHRAAELGIMPRVMSYAGLNFDILTGAAAIVIAVLMLVRVGIPRRTLWVWNVWGIACLAMIIFLAVATSPMLHLWGTEPEQLNTWVTYPPYVWLPSVLVVTAIASHIVITRKLLAQKSP